MKKILKNEKLTIGVDVGATNIRCGVVTEYGKIIETLTDQTSSISDGSGLLNQTTTMIVRLIKKYPEIHSIGIAMPGPVNPKTKIVYVLPNLLIGTIDIVSHIKKTIDLPVYITNDANAAALSEALIGAGKGYRVVQYITLSTGIGGGLIINNEIYTGTHGFAQEIGNMIIGPKNQRPNPTMNPGSFEYYCSGTSLIMQAKESGVNVTHAGEVFKHPNCQAIVNRWLNYLAIAIGNIITLYEPDIFVLGGGIMKSHQYFLHRLQNIINEHIFNDLKNKIIIVKAHNDQTAGIIGAGLLPYHQL
jgi:predicted NBD/HSP70 family sugar kinase